MDLPPLHFCRSSTETVAGVRAGESLEGFLSPEAAAYIKKKRLYEG